MGLSEKTPNLIQFKRHLNKRVTRSNFNPKIFKFSVMNVCDVFSFLHNNHKMFDVVPVFPLYRYVVNIYIIIRNNLFDKEKERVFHKNEYTKVQMYDFGWICI